MTADAIQLTSLAFKALLETALVELDEPGKVYLGPPSDSDAADAAASLFLYHLVPNADLRNEPDLRSMRAPDPGQTGLPNSIPFDLRYLITVIRKAGLGLEGDPLELLTLGQIIRAIHATPVLSGARLPRQAVRLTPDPVSMEEISRVWGLFPETAYRTSIVYLATPVFVDAAEFPVGPRVGEVHRHGGRLQAAGAR